MPEPSMKLSILRFGSLFLFGGKMMFSATDRDVIVDAGRCSDRFLPTNNLLVESIGLLTALSEAFCHADAAPFTTAFVTF